MARVRSRRVPDDEHDLETGTVALFDLDLLRPAVFVDGDAVRLLASRDGFGSKNVPGDVLAAAVARSGSEIMQRAFEVTSGALAVSVADWPADELALDVSKMPMLTKKCVIIPCANGRYAITELARVAAEAGGFDHMLQVTLRRA